MSEICTQTSDDRIDDSSCLLRGRRSGCKTARSRAAQRMRGCSSAVARRTFTLMLPAPMREALRADYGAMAGMIFAEVPLLDEVLDTVENAERCVSD
ncbi:MAG: hypothetical protein E6H79_20535 [Betaproteobacteria bacterium]|nr:MAG: hypothetical protein E6H79_20535 [Betaproteobacteria bacterium]